MKLIDPRSRDSFECWREATMVVEEMKDHRFWKEEAGLMEDQWPTRSDEDYNDSRRARCSATSASTSSWRRAATSAAARS